MYGETRGKQAIKDFVSKVRLRANAVKNFYPKKEYLSVVYCALTHNELNGIVSTIENIDYVLTNWKTPLSRDTILWAIEQLDASNLVEWEM